MISDQPLARSGLKYRWRKFVCRCYPLLSPFLPRGYRPYTFVGGKIFLDLREHKNMFRRVLGLYEVNKVQALYTLLKPNGTFIDVGSNKGDFALLAARLVGPAGRVIACEPEPANCEWIQRSISLNGYGNVNLQRLALSDTNGRAELFLGARSGWHSLVGNTAQRREDGACIDVELETLDKMVAELGQPPVDVIKIDVEGAEMRVLRGARETLQRNPQIVLLLDLHPQLGVDVQEVATFLKGLGFSLYSAASPFPEITAGGARKSSPDGRSSSGANAEAPD